MGTKRQITEYLDIDLEKELWCCNRCGHEIISARENYKKGCLVYIRKDLNTIYNSPVKGPFGFAPDPTWAMLVEFYCPGCGTMVENEMLPPGINIVVSSLSMTAGPETILPHSSFIWL